MFGKRLFAFLLAMVLMVSVLPTGVFAAGATSGTCGDNVTWSLDDGVLTIVGTGPMYDYNGTNDQPWAYYAQTITEVVIGEGVTTVGKNAFVNCSGMLCAELPDTLKSIGGSGFNYCNKLTDIVLPEGLETIGAMAFFNCDGLKSIVIPASVVAVGNSAFATCRFVKTATINSSEVQWGNGVFENCIRLEQVNFAAGSTQITPWMFSSCEKLESIQLPDNLTKIGNNAFIGCKALKSITIPAGVTSVGEYAFRRCTALREIRFLGNAPAIGRYAFKDSSVVAYYPRGNTTWTRDVMGNYDGEIVWSDGVNAFYSASGSANWTLENGVLTIDDYLMDLPNYEADPNSRYGLIPWYPFAQSIKEVVIGPGITGVGRNTFYGCDNLRAIRFMGNAPRLEETFLKGVTATVYYPGNNPTWTAEVMQQYGGKITWVATGITPLEIIKQPESVVVGSGRKATVTVEAEGEGLTYKWYYKNQGASKFSLTTSFTGNTYSVTMSEARSGRQVYCVITDKFGNSISTETVTLHMGTFVKITKQPEDVMVAAGEEAVVTVEAQGDGLTYKWYFKNPGASKFSRTTTFTGNTYKVNLAANRSGRQVYCVITDKYGNSVTTDTVTLTVGSKTELKITKQPEDVTVAEGEEAVVTVEAQGDGLTYQWYFKNPGASKFSLTTTFTGNTYSVNLAEKRSGRQVYCVITDKYGNSVTTDTVTLTVGSKTELKITKQPEDVTVAAGEEAVVTVEAQGDGLTYKWYFKNPGASKFSLTTTFTGNTYSVNLAANRSGRQVYCVITDKYGNSVTTDTVTLTVASKTELKITKQPEDVTVAAGEKAVVTVEAQGDGLTYKWYFKNPGASKFSLTTTFTGNTYSVNLAANRSGRQVYCVITDKYGNSVTTDTVTLTVASKTELKITKQPEDVTVAAGEKAVVTVEAQGDGLTYKWYFKNAGASKFSLTTSFKSNTYSVVMSDARNGRQIYCVITDQYGNSVTTDTVVLTME